MNEILLATTQLRVKDLIVAPDQALTTRTSKGRSFATQILLQTNGGYMRENDRLREHTRAQV